VKRRPSRRNRVVAEESAEAAARNNQNEMPRSVEGTRGSVRRLLADEVNTSAGL
jgi:hypothetical protein